MTSFLTMEKRRGKERRLLENREKTGGKWEGRALEMAQRGKERNLGTRGEEHESAARPSEKREDSFHHASVWVREGGQAHQLGSLHLEKGAGRDSAQEAVRERKETKEKK